MLEIWYKCKVKGILCFYGTCCQFAEYQRMAWMKGNKSNRPIVYIICKWKTVPYFWLHIEWHNRSVHIPVQRQFLQHAFIHDEQYVGCAPYYSCYTAFWMSLFQNTPPPQKKTNNKSTKRWKTLIRQTQSYDKSIVCIWYSMNGIWMENR